MEVVKMNNWKVEVSIGKDITLINKEKDQRYRVAIMDNEIRILSNKATLLKTPKFVKQMVLDKVIEVRGIKEWNILN
jgi:hypothetical protein